MTRLEDPTHKKYFFNKKNNHSIFFLTLKEGDRNLSTGLISKARNQPTWNKCAIIQSFSHMARHVLFFLSGGLNRSVPANTFPAQAPKERVKELSRGAGSLRNGF